MNLKSSYEVNPHVSTANSNVPEFNCNAKIFVINTELLFDI